MRLQIPDDCCATARRLLAAGSCTPDEMLEFYRGDVLCLRGKARVFAERRVKETTRVGPVYVSYDQTEAERLARLSN